MAASIYAGGSAARRQAERGLPLLPFLPLLAIPVLGSDPASLDTVVIAMIFCFLIAAVREPVWAIGAFLLSELTIRNFYLEIGSLQISTRLVISLLVPLIVMPAVVASGFNVGPRAKAIFILAGIFFAGTCISNLVYSDVAFTLKFARYLYTGMVALVLVPLAVRDRRDLVLISALGLLIAVTSALVATSQHYSDRGIPLIELVPNAVVLEGFEGWQGRALGLAENPVYLTNDLLSFFFAPLAMLFLLKPERARIFLLTIVLLLLALYFSQTRSWVLGAVPGMIAVALALGGDAKRVLLGIILIGTVGFWLWIGYSGNRYSEDDDDSAATRPVLWAASARIALDNPVLGVGHNKFLELSPEYASSISRSVRENQDAVGALGNTQPHNDFLNVWLSFGTMAFAVFVALFVLIGRAFLEGIRRTPDPVLKGIGAGGLGALVAFAANSAFHNFFDSTLTLWLLGGFAIALVKVAVIEEGAGRKVAQR